MGIEIREIKEKDKKGMYKFCLGIFEEMGWDKNFTYGLDNLKKFFGGEREIFIVAKLGKKIMACAGLKELSKKDGLIKRFYVAKEFRGRGLAGLMLKIIKKFAREKNYKTIMVDIFQDNLRAKKFFQKKGFSIFNPSPRENWPESKHPKLFEFKKLEL
ncbi:MAG: GNAT family N-acetyltransferase [Candidatus Nealsonbacteria bacterium]|nr:GNAT family N-acetyltransferase [Candidatus Nealsonbacteria bacterium]